MVPPRPLTATAQAVVMGDTPGARRRLCHSQYSRMSLNPVRRPRIDGSTHGRSANAPQSGSQGWRRGCSDGRIAVRNRKGLARSRTARPIERAAVVPGVKLLTVDTNASKDLHSVHGHRSQRAGRALVSAGTSGGPTCPWSLWPRDSTRSPGQRFSQPLAVLRAAKMITERRDRHEAALRGETRRDGRTPQILDGFWTERLERLRGLSECGRGKRRTRTRADR